MPNNVFSCQYHQNRPKNAKLCRAVASGGPVVPATLHLKSVPPISRLAHWLLHTFVIQYFIFKMCPPFWFLAPPAAKFWRRAWNYDVHAKHHFFMPNPKPLWKSPNSKVKKSKSKFQFSLKIASLATLLVKQASEAGLPDFFQNLRPKPW